MIIKKLWFISLFLFLVLINNTHAEVKYPDEIVLEGDYYIEPGDSLKVTALFDGTFTWVNSVQIICYLNDVYSRGESCQYIFYNNDNTVAYTTTHVCDYPFGLEDLGILTNKDEIGDIFKDGSATFTIAMLSGSSSISSIYIRIEGTYVPPLPKQGDINNDGIVDLEDCIISLKIISGLPLQSSEVNVSADVNGDNKIGIEDTIFILQEVSKSQ